MEFFDIDNSNKRLTCIFMLPRYLQLYLSDLREQTGIAPIKKQNTGKYECYLINKDDLQTLQDFDAKWCESLISPGMRIDLERNGHKFTVPPHPQIYKNKHA